MFGSVSSSINVCLVLWRDGWEKRPISSSTSNYARHSPRRVIKMFLIICPPHLAYSFLPERLSVFSFTMTWHTLLQQQPLLIIAAIMNIHGVHILIFPGRDFEWRLSFHSHPLLFMTNCSLGLNYRSPLIPQRKCDMYWPKEGSETYGIITVKLLQEVVMATYILRTFTIRNSKVKKVIIASCLI